MQLKIREIANEKGITLMELSKRLGITNVTLYHYADGLKTPTLERTYKIANELGVTIEDLIMEEAGIAAKELNRSFIGIEIDEKYFNIAKQRLEQVQLSLF